jgi:hypothetical protein
MIEPAVQQQYLGKAMYLFVVSPPLKRSFREKYSLWHFLNFTVRKKTNLNACMGGAREGFIACLYDNG